MRKSCPRALRSRPGLALAGVTVANLLPSPRPEFPLLWNGDGNPSPYRLLRSTQTPHVHQGQPSTRFLREKEEASLAPEQWDWKVWTRWEALAEAERGVGCWGLTVLA